MLHGWAQNAHVFRHKTRTLTKKLNSNGMDCLFLGGPIVLPPLLVESKPEQDGMESSTNNDTTTTRMGREEARAWFLYQRDDDPNTNDDYWQSGRPIEYVGLDESLRYLEGHLKADFTKGLQNFPPWFFTRCCFLAKSSLPWPHHGAGHGIESKAASLLVDFVPHPCTGVRSNSANSP